MTIAQDILDLWDEQCISSVYFHCADIAISQCDDYIDMLYTTYTFADNSSLTLCPEGVAQIVF